MNQDQTVRRLLLTAEICQQMQLYAQEVTRENCSRAFLESFASRALKRCAELYAVSRPEASATPQAQPPSPVPFGTAEDRVRALRVVKSTEEPTNAA